MNISSNSSVVILNACLTISLTFIFGVSVQAQYFFKVYEEANFSRGFNIVEHADLLEIETALNYLAPMNGVVRVDEDGILIDHQPYVGASHRQYHLKDDSYIETFAYEDNGAFKLLWVRHVPGELGQEIFEINLEAGQVGHAGIVDEFADGTLYLSYDFGEQANLPPAAPRTMGHVKFDLTAEAVVWQKEYESSLDVPAAYHQSIYWGDNEDFFVIREEDYWSESSWFITKFDAAGDMIWDNPSGGVSKLPIALAPASDGGVFYIVNQVLQDVFKINSEGEDDIELFLSNYFQADAKPTAIAPAFDNQIIVMGSLLNENDKLFSVILDNQLNIIHSHLFDEFEEKLIPHFISTYQADEYLVTGETNPSTANASPFLLKLNSKGNPFVQLMDCDTGETTMVFCDDGNPCTINDFEVVLNADGSICEPCHGTPILCALNPDCLSEVVCDDGDPCTINDKQIIRTVDGAICEPCMGEAIDCSTGSTMSLPCDDGNAMTINDLQTVLDCDGSVCIPCAGVPVDCNTGDTSMQACDDGDPCTINDFEVVLDANGSICEPCMGEPFDCSTGATTVVPCDDGNAMTINDLQTILDCNGTICIPCVGEPVDCTTGDTSVQLCDDGNPCTTNDFVVILDANGSICEPCTGLLQDCSTGPSSVVPCDDGDPMTINDMQTILDCDASVCVPCAGIPDSTVAVQELQQLELSIFPNPSTDLFTIQQDGPSDFIIRVFSNQGQLIFSKKNALTIDLRQQVSGVYWLQFLSLENGVVVHRKLVLL